MDKRLKHVEWGPGKPRKRTSKANWKKPLKWDREAKESGVRRRVFCASLADVFDNEVPQEWRDELWALIKATPHLDWIIVTKRIGNAKKMLPADWNDGYPNVWLLITVVNKEEADRDMPKLFGVPSVVSGVSVEPQLEDIDLIPYMGGRSYKCQCEKAWHHTENNRLCPRSLDMWCMVCGQFAEIFPTLDLVISGAESGPKHRDYDENWARSLRDQCQETNTAFYYKQNIVNGKKIETPELDGKRWMEFPE